MLIFSYFGTFQGWKIYLEWLKIPHEDQHRWQTQTGLNFKSNEN